LLRSFGIKFSAFDFSLLHFQQQIWILSI
jgi:hypothetical protein